MLGLRIAVFVFSTVVWTHYYVSMYIAKRRNKATPHKDVDMSPLEPDNKHSDDEWREWYENNGHDHEPC